MEMFREGGSTWRPLMLKGANYPYRKTKMRAFLRAVDEIVWVAIEEGWFRPTMMENEMVIPKPMSRWTTDEMERANFNSKALHALFNAVSTNQLKVIANCEIAKEAWEKLKIKNEGTNAVKKSRLRALAKAFENLIMEENETVIEFHAMLCDISNESYALRKTYSNSKLVQKVLGVLLRRFMSKVTSIEEIRNIEAECANTLKKNNALVCSDNEEEKNSTASESTNEDKQVLVFMVQSCLSIEYGDECSFHYIRSRQRG
uniref:Gag-pol polyprotein n=1 Tax=Cannabis sativa TaxID=3483 RepID=A0A803PCR4_CANSA